MIICISMIFLSDFLWTEIYFSKLISRNAFQNIRIKKLFIESFSHRREFQNDSRIIEIEWREPYLITSCLFKMFKSQGHFFDKYLFRFYLSSTSACNDPMSCENFQIVSSNSFILNRSLKCCSIFVLQLISEKFRWWANLHWL